jgi:NADP-dependent 3-hydroxy acid dehydrogenase YdfG
MVWISNRFRAREIGRLRAFRPGDARTPAAFATASEHRDVDDRGSRPWSVFCSVDDGGTPAMEISLRPIEDQVIVITGASSGIGLATARAAARRGACVVLAARSDETLSDVVEAIEAEGGSAIAVTTDVSDRAQMEALAEAAIGRFGRIDTWVNNAGVAIYGRLDQVSDADNRKLFDTNFWGVVYGSQVALPHLKKNGGALINVGSEVSDAVAPLQGMYSASKHAVKGFTDALRVEIELVDDANVSITLIQPTAVNTPYPEHARNYMAQEPALPDGQIEPGKVADAILDAATQHRRDVKVGGSAKRNTLASNLIPGAADAMTAKLVHKQQRNETPREPQGTLDQPGFSGREHGRGRENTRAADRADIVDELARAARHRRHLCVLAGHRRLRSGRPRRAHATGALSRRPRTTHPGAEQLSRRIRRKGAGALA